MQVALFTGETASAGRKLSSSVRRHFTFPTLREEAVISSIGGNGEGCGIWQLNEGVHAKCERGGEIKDYTLLHRASTQLHATTMGA